ncbi:MAG: PKD domain-containing protein [Bacteroidota bacterium]
MLIFLIIKPALAQFPVNDPVIPEPVYVPSSKTGGINKMQGTCTNCVPGTLKDGSGTLGNTYNNSACGLNFTQYSAKTTTRYPTPPGTGFPATLTISGLADCSEIEQAYLYYTASTSSSNVSLSVTDPLSTTINYSATIIGSGVDKCWGKSWSRNYRVDVTPSITVNGNYQIDIALGPWDVDGVTLFIIFVDPTAPYQGTLIINDGCIANNNGGTESQTLTGFNACGNSTSAIAFMIVADMQDNVAASHPATLNGVAGSYPNSFYTWHEVNTSITSGQSTSAFSTNGNGNDCFDWMVMGLYFQTTTCVVCTPPPDSALTLTSTITDEVCGTCNGAATVSTTDGIAPYTYQWDANAGNQTTQTATGLCAGTFTVNVIDATGCISGVETVTINSIGGINVDSTSIDLLCASICDGSATATVTGGVTPYTYLWNDGNNQTTQTATGLCANTYTVTVTDALGCVQTINVIINEPPPLALNFGNSDATCFGSCNGFASVIPSGGTIPYSYQWTPAPGGGQGTPNAFAMCAGTYTLVVTDNNACTANIASFVINEPPDFTIATSSTAAHCGQPDGDATVTVGGATPGYVYQWNANAGNQTTPTATGLTPGMYYVTVTDNLSCDSLISVSVADTPGPVASAVSAQTTCNGDCDGTATGSAALGTTPYTYQWNDPNNQTNSIATGLCAGTYSVTITDVYNCPDAIQVDVLEPTTVVVSPSSDTICIGECTILDANPSGGNGGPYTCYWNDGTVNQFDTVCPVSSSTYSVYAMDVNNCTSTPQNVFVFVYPPLSTIASDDQTVCENTLTNISAIASGGNGGPYTYTWDNGAGQGQNVTVTAPSYPNSIIYTVTVSDNCGTPPATDSTLITVYPLPSANFNNDTVCLNDTTEFTDISTIPSGTIVSWEWDFGDGNTSTIQNPEYLYGSDGTYNVTLTVTSNNGCLNTTAQQVIIYPNPGAFFLISPQPTTVMNTLISFTDYSTGLVNQWYWSFYNNDGETLLGDDTIQDPSFGFPPDTGFFPVNLLVTTDKGCPHDTTLNVLLQGDFALFAPNAFTPNLDLVNDTFLLKGIGFSTSCGDIDCFEIYIYNRWGDLIYEFRGNFHEWEGWDGKANDGYEKAQQDVYVWLVHAKDINGRKHQFVGHVTLIR